MEMVCSAPPNKGLKQKGLSSEINLGEYRLSSLFFLSLLFFSFSFLSLEEKARFCLKANGFGSDVL